MPGCSPMSRPSCSSPRAWTSKASLEFCPARTLSETLVSASRTRRSPILVLVRCWPVLPARGESLGENIMLQWRNYELTFMRVLAWSPLPLSHVLAASRQQNRAYRPSPPSPFLTSVEWNAIARYHFPLFWTRNQLCICFVAGLNAFFLFILLCKEHQSTDKIQIAEFLSQIAMGNPGSEAFHSHLRVGGSISPGASASVRERAPTVSAILVEDRPVMETISPAPAVSKSMRPVPDLFQILVSLPSSPDPPEQY